MMFKKSNLQAHQNHCCSFNQQRPGRNKLLVLLLTMSMFLFMATIPLIAGVATESVGGPTVLGELEWMTDNLSSMTCEDGTPIDSKNYQQNGGQVIYNVVAVETCNVCPKGWRLPTKQDFKGLGDQGLSKEQVAKALNINSSSLSPKGYLRIDDGLVYQGDLAYILKGGSFTSKGDASNFHPVRCVRNAINQDLVPLDVYWSNDRQDNLLAATEEGKRVALAFKYIFIETTGYIFKDQQPGTIPLLLFWNPQRTDNYTCATDVGIERARLDGYTNKPIRTTGYIFKDQQPGTVPLKLYWNVQREDNYATATEKGEQTAIGAGYKFIRIEGYVYPNSKP